MKEVKLKIKDDKWNELKIVKEKEQKWKRLFFSF